MISVSGKKWEEKITNKNSIEKIKQDYNFSDILSKLVITRKFNQTELNSIDNHLDLNNVFFKIRTFMSNECFGCIVATLNAYTRQYITSSYTSCTKN